MTGHRAPHNQAALIAATSATLGALISQITTIVISWTERKRQKNILLRQKYEEMWLSFSASLEWLQHLNGSTSQEAVFALAQNPAARKSVSLCLLYFQEEFGDSANNYLLAQSAYYQSLILSYDKNDNNTAGGQFLMKDPKCPEIADNLMRIKNTFENQIISNAHKYTIA